MAETKTINLEVKEKGMEEFGQKTLSLKAQLKELKAQMAAAGDGTAEFRRLAAEAGALQDRIADVNRQVKNLSSDTRRLDLGVEVVQGAVGAYSAAQGAMYLFGAESEEMQKTMMKVMGAMSLANGVQQVANVLNKDAVLGTQLRILWNDKLVGTFKKLTDAQKIFAVTGVGLLLTALGTLIANFDDLTSSIFGVSESQQALNETVEDYQKGAAEAIEITSKVGATFQMARDGVVSKEEALNYYNETLGDTFGKALSLDEAETLWAKKTQAYIKATGLRAQAQALFAKAAEAAAKGTTAGLEDQTTWYDKLGQAAVQNLGGMNQGLEYIHGKQKQRVKEAEKDAKETQKILTDLATQMLEDATKIEKENDIVAKSNQHKNKKVVHSNKNARKDDLENLKQYQKDAEDLFKSQYEKEVEAINAKYDEQIALAKKNNVDTTILEKARDKELMTALDKSMHQIKTLSIEKAQIAENDLGTLRGTINEELVLKQQAADEEINILQAKAGRANRIAEQAQAFQVQSTLDGLSAIASITELFGKKSERAAKRAFNVQKAANIASALITTYQNATSAYASQFTPIPTPDSPIRGGIAAGIAVASGLANVAKISQQQFSGGTSSSGGASGGGGGSIPSVAPSFNVVGNSGMNQLAQIQQTPLQAYVVSGEVTSAQALDRNRIKNATL